MQTMGDLHNALLARIEALESDDLSGEDLDREIRRSEAIAKIAVTVIANARVVLDAERLVSETGRIKGLPAMLTGQSDRNRGRR